jgi:selenocysteine lyase/cysteine desulfurase
MALADGYPTPRLAFCVDALVTERYIRISPSVFNDMGDIDKLLEALS